MDPELFQIMFRPPICRGMRKLDRAFFRRTVPLKAARVFNVKDIAQLRTDLRHSGDVLVLQQQQSVQPDPDPTLAKSGAKCIVLRPEVRLSRDPSKTLTSCGSSSSITHEAEPWPHSPLIARLVEERRIDVVPFNLELDYSYWTYHSIISSILPEDALDEIPSGFSQIGHVAHLNLREEYLPYKNIIGEIILDKNIGVRTVINKIHDVGEDDEFRTFGYEVLAGPDDMDVEVSEENCLFRFDFSKVYWNPRLGTEHRRLVSLFNKGEAVCDLMAGVGPFAVPAGKKGIFVWANDLNPDSYTSLQDAIQRNKVSPYVCAFNEDARSFVRKAVASLVDSTHTVEQKPPRSDRRTKSSSKLHSSNSGVQEIRRPQYFSHFVLNLPAIAPTFLPSFIGIYPKAIHDKLPQGTPLPIIHVYCFSTKDELENDEGAERKICVEISKQLGFDMNPGKIEDGGIIVHDVRDVAPKKRMFCASFRLPAEVAFRSAD